MPDPTLDSHPPAPVAAAATRRRIPVWGWILIVLAGIGVPCVLAFGFLAVFVVPNVLKRLEVAQRSKAEVDLMSLESAAREYRIMNRGAWPDSLADLVTPDVNGRKFLEGAAVPVDPWGFPYRYDRPRTSDEPPHVYSLGRDGAVGGDGADADIHRFGRGTREER